jgi:hypothetical protein
LSARSCLFPPSHVQRSQDVPVKPNKPNKLASHMQRSQDVPVNFPWKLTKDKVVKFQNLELAGWYQTVPYLRL